MGRRHHLLRESTCARSQKPRTLPLDAALVGEGICAPDPEERFFYWWRALGVLGHWDLSVARTLVENSGVAASGEYFEAVSEPILNGQYARLNAQRLVEISVRQRGLVPNPLPVARLFRLRTAIAHGEVTAEETLEIMRGSQEIFELAHAAVAMTLDSFKSS
jgi:hypothetical protein